MVGASQGTAESFLHCTGLPKFAVRSRVEVSARAVEFADGASVALRGPSASFPEANGVEAMARSMFERNSATTAVDSYCGLM